MPELEDEAIATKQKCLMHMGALLACLAILLGGFYTGFCTPDLLPADLLLALALLGVIERLWTFSKLAAVPAAE